MTATRLFVDGGQTGTRLRLIDTGGHVADTVTGPVDTGRGVLEQIAARVSEVLAGTGDRDVEVAVGLSGLTDEAARPEELTRALAGFGVGQVVLAHDSVTAYLAANAHHRGVVVAAGTGVVTLGVGPEGIVRVDGWGHLLGDAGSAYWIGRAGLDAALRAFDGRGTPTALTRAATDLFGPLPELYMALQADPARVRRIAGFARTIDELADGDHTAAAVLDRAGTELAGSATAALIRAGLPAGNGARVSWTGTVLTRNARVRQSFLDAVTTTAPGAVIGPPFGEPIDGVGQLLDLPADHPLSALVRRTGGL